MTIIDNAAVERTLLVKEHHSTQKKRDRGLNCHGHESR
jgi:hypothetical protein